MSVIKKWLPVLIVSIAIASIAFMVGCDWQAEFGQTRSEVTTGETVAAVKETVAEAKVKGTIYETELFSILVPDGWVTEGLSAEDLPSGDVAAEGSVGVWITKDKDSMILYVLLDIPDAATFSKEAIEGNIELLNGTALGEVTMLGIKFFGESHTSDGDYQSVYYGDRNGDVVIISMVGKDHENNVEIKAMLDSIKFK